MQSLGQAVYRYVCSYSRAGQTGVAERAIIREMAARGYLEPLRERVDSALNEYSRMDRIMLRRGRFVKVPYLRSSSNKVLRVLTQNI